VERELAERFQARTNPFKLRNPEEAAREVEPQMHVYGPNAQCITDTSLGKATPQDRRDPLRLVLNAQRGVVQLWAEGTTLRWRFRERSFLLFEDPEGAKSYVQDLFGASILSWGDAYPIRFAYAEDRWDFEIAINWVSDCTISNGSKACVLASAFFPGSGPSTVWVYPEAFEQSPQEQVETFAHEFGHVVGLRHYFALAEETDFPAELFGTQNPFSIMNYGSESVLTPDDRADLKRLYEAAWSGELKEIGRSPIQLVKPFSTT